MQLLDARVFDGLGRQVEVTVEPESPLNHLNSVFLVRFMPVSSGMYTLRHVVVDGIMLNIETTFAVKGRPIGDVRAFVEFGFNQTSFDPTGFFRIVFLCSVCKLH